MHLIICNLKIWEKRNGNVYFSVGLQGYSIIKKKEPKLKSLSSLPCASFDCAIPGICRE